MSSAVMICGSMPIRLQVLSLFRGEMQRKLLIIGIATCPKCDHGRAYFYMLQIRSADEPMTTCMFFFVFCIDLTRIANKFSCVQSTGVVLSLLTISWFLLLHIDVLAVHNSGEKISSGHKGKVRSVYPFSSRTALL